MKFAIQRIVRPVQMREYAEEYGDECIWTWANPPRATRLEFYQIADEYKKLVEGADSAEEGEQDTGLAGQLETLMGRFHEWWSVLWSQHSDPETHWSAEDVRELVDVARDTDPALWGWLQEACFEIMREHREGVKKK